MRYYCIINPAAKSGRGGVIWKRAKKMLDGAGAEYRYYFTRKDRNGICVAKRILQQTEGEITLLVLGGDGTVNEVINGIAAMGLEHFGRVRFVYLPAGSSNDLARALHYPADSLHILKAMLSYDKGGIERLGERRMDIGELTYYQAMDEKYKGKKRYFAVSAGIGFDAAVCAEALHSVIKKRLNDLGLGGLAYVMICLKNLLLAPECSCYVFMDGKRIRHGNGCLFAAVMNHPYQGGGVMFAPEAVDDDGRLDICFTDNMPKGRVLLTLPKAYKGKHTKTKGICMDRAEKIRIACDTMLYVHTDGEVSVKAREIGMRCVPKVLRLMVV